jgi:hypothetical protein
MSTYITKVILKVNQYIVCIYNLTKSKWEDYQAFKHTERDKAIQFALDLSMMDKKTGTTEIFLSAPAVTKGYL